MVINIEDIFIGVLIVIFGAAALEHLVFPFLGAIGSILSNLYKYCSKYCVIAWKWLKNLRWYYKWLMFIAFVVVCLIFDWINGLLAAWVVFAYCFAKWLIDLWHKACAAFDKWNKNPPKKDFDSF